MSKATGATKGRSQDFQDGYHRGYVNAKRKFEQKLKNELDAEKAKPRELSTYWPYNIVSHMNEYHYDKNDYYLFSPTLIIQVLKQFLNADECRIMELRYRENLTLQEVGDRFGITRERVRQKEHKAFEKLRYQFFKSKITAVSSLAYEELKEKYVALKKEIDEIKGKDDYEERVHIGDLDLGTRATNCLYRKGIRYADELQKFKYRDIALTQSLGAKSIADIANKLKSIGYEVNTTDFDEPFAVKQKGDDFIA